jgi:PPP family 3-phenylpropionic acid transporter
MAVPYKRLSSFYFFYFATFGLFLPYWNLYLKQEGFNAIEIGELSALLLGTKIIAPNLCGIIADCTGKGLKIIRIVTFFTAFLFTGFFFKSGYFWFTVMTLGFSFFWNASLPQFEALTLFHLKDKPHQYSQIRLWGSLGFIAAVKGISFLLDDYNLRILPIIVISLFVLIWLNTLIVPEVNIQRDEKKDTELWQIIKKPQTLIFFTVFMLLQAAHGPYYVFYSIYLKELGYSTEIIGDLWALAVVAEVIILLLMRTLLAVLSLRRILLWSVFFSIIRWLIVGWMADSLYWLIVSQLLNAITFGSSHVVAIHLVHQYFGNQHQGKGQALYSSTSFGLGGMLGSFLSGYYWEKFTPEIIYSVGAGVCVLAFFLSFWAVTPKTHP